MLDLFRPEQVGSSLPADRIPPAAALAKLTQVRTRGKRGTHARGCGEWATRGVSERPPWERSSKWRASLVVIVERTLLPTQAVKFLSLTLATTCLLGLVTACGGHAPAGPDAVRERPVLSGPGSRVPGPAVISGLVVDEDTGQGLAGVKVDAVGASYSTSFSLTTDTAGAFRMELFSGVVRFWLSRPGYVTYDRERFVPPGTTTLQIALKKATVPPPAPPTPFRLTGLVTDLQGNPVAGAAVNGYRNDSPVDDSVGRTSTDPSGRFLLITARAPQDVQVTRLLYQQTNARVGLFSADSTATITIRMPRFIAYVLVAPPSVRVGETVQITARVELDNGSPFATAAGPLISSNPAVLTVIDRHWVRGIAPGSVTVSGVYEGVLGTVPLRVDP